MDYRRAAKRCVSRGRTARVPDSQRPHHDVERQADVSGRLARKPLPDPGRWLLRVDLERQDKAGVAEQADGGRPVRVRRNVGELESALGDRTRRIVRGIDHGGYSRDLHDPHGPRQQGVDAGARAHARDHVPDPFNPWLLGETTELCPYLPKSMPLHCVSTLVNNTANGDPRCSEPIAVRSKANKRDRRQIFQREKPRLVGSAVTKAGLL